jgi:hypothetical protein
MIPAVHRDHLIVFAEVRDLSGPASDVAAVTVDEQKRLPSTINLVVETHALVNKGMPRGRIGAVPDNGRRCLGALCLSAGKARR